MENMKIMLTKEQQEVLDKISDYQLKLYCRRDVIFMCPDSEAQKFLNFFIDENFFIHVKEKNCVDMCKEVGLPKPNFICDAHSLIFCWGWEYDELEPEEKKKWEEKAEKSENQTGEDIWLDEGDEHKWYNEAIDKIYYGIYDYFDQLKEKYDYYIEDTYDELEEKLEETIFNFFEVEKIKVSKRDIIKMIDDLDLD